MLYKDKNWLHQKYIVEKLNTQQISRLCKCDRTTVAHWLKRLGFHVRGTSECWTEERSKKQSERQKGKLNPNFKDSKKEVKCSYCENILLRSRPRREKNKYNFCNYDCKNKWQKIELLKEKNPCWRGGVTYNREKRENKFYIKWRLQILKRDDYTCQLCYRRGKQLSHIKGRTKLNVHHIFPWCDFKELRYDLNNGITLCKECHNKTKGKEYFFIPLFLRTINNK